VTLVRILAWRRLADRPLRSCLTAAGVAVGVAFLFSMLSLNLQLSTTVRDTAALLDHPRLLQVTPSAPGGLPDGVVATLAADPRVEAAAPLLVMRSEVEVDGRDTGVFVLAASPESAGVLPQDALPTMDAIELSDDGGDIAVTRALARRLRVEPGDELIVDAPTGETPLRIGAVVSLPALDRINGGLVVAMFLDRAQEVFARAGRVDQVMVLGRTGVDLDELRRDLADSLDGVGIVGAPGDETGPDFTFVWAQLFTISAVAVVALAALVLVFHTMSMATAERRTEIALARSLGSTRRQLVLVTLAEAGLLGVVGSAVGIATGGLLAKAVVPLAAVAFGGGAPVDLPTDVNLHPIPAAIAGIAGVVGALVGALLPARAAGRAAPVDALRPAATYEWRDPARPSRRLAIGALGAGFIVAGVALVDRPASGRLTDPTAPVPYVLVFQGALLLVPMLIPFASSAAAWLLARVSTTGRLAGDALCANRRRTTINVMALLLPVTVVITMEVAFDGSLDAIERLARANVAAPLNVDSDTYVGGPASPVASQPLAAAHQPVLEAVPGVRAVLPYENAHVRLPHDTRGVVYAIPLAAAARAGVPDMVQAQALANDRAAFVEGLVTGEIAASHFAARALDLEVGRSLTLPTPTGPRAFTVAALFDDYAFQPTFYVDLDTYRDVWGDDGAHRFAIVPDGDVALADLTSRVEATVDGGAIPGRVVTRETAVAELASVTTTFLPLARGMTLASLVFAVLALANAAFTAVNERRWLFALQQTMGMTRREIARSLALEALVVGAIGTLGATIVGIGLAHVNNRFLGNVVALTLGVSVPWAFVGVCAVLGVAIALGATYLPRRTARRATIIESLRFD